MYGLPLCNKVVVKVGCDRWPQDVFHLFVKPQHVLDSFVMQDDHFRLLHIEDMIETANAGPNKLQEGIVLQGGDVVAKSRQEGFKIDVWVCRHICTTLKCVMLTYLAIL